MGLLAYGALGALRGGSRAYVDIKESERKEQEKIRSEQRAQDIWEKRQQRLKEIGFETADHSLENQKELADYGIEVAVEKEKALDPIKAMQERRKARLETDTYREKKKADREAMPVSDGTAVINANTGEKIYENPKESTGKASDAPMYGYKGQGEFDRILNSTLRTALNFADTGGFKDDADQQRFSALAKQVKPFMEKEWSRGNRISIPEAVGKLTVKDLQLEVNKEVQDSAWKEAERWARKEADRILSEKADGVLDKAANFVGMNNEEKDDLAGRLAIQRFQNMMRAVQKVKEDIQKHPESRAAIIQAAKARGIPTDGL